MTASGASAAPSSRPAWLRAPLRALGDQEGARVPAQLPPVVDAHVHLFPDRVFEAIWRWFDAHGWPIRYKLHSPQVIDFLLSRGVSRLVALHYSHKPGMARLLNQYVAEICAAEPRVVGLATVMPGEPDAPAILQEAFRLGLKGVKLHCHVQCFAPDSPQAREVYEVCAAAGKPVVMHAGREPASPHYACDVRQLCSAERVERVLQDYRRLKLCVPHLGADQFEHYQRMLERFDNLWLDTTMLLAEYFDVPLPLRLIQCRPDRILYGTDFPNLPYAWDRELRKLISLKLPADQQAQVLGENALAFFR